MKTAAYAALLLTLSTACFGTQSAQAAEGRAKSKKRAPQNQSAATADGIEGSRFSGVMWNRLSSTLDPLGSTESAVRLSSTFGLGYQLSKKWSTELLFVASQELTDERLFRVSNPELRFMRSVVNTKTFQAVIGPSLTIPANVDSLQKESLYGGHGLAAVAVLDMGSAIRGLKLTYEFAPSQYLHQYTLGTDGASNVKYTVSNAIVLGQSFSDSVSLTALSAIVNNWSYEGNLATVFQFRQELDYRLTPVFQIGVGHQVGGDWLAANGQDIGVVLFNQRSSRFYGAVNVSF